MRRYLVFLLFYAVVFVSIFSLTCSNESNNNYEDVYFTEDSIDITDLSQNRCKVKADCPKDHYCDRGVGMCKEGDCFDNTDCNEGYMCDSYRHYCYFVGCAKDSDCKEGICKRSTGRCIGCLTDSDCKGGNCNSSINICISGDCVDDKLEPNDSFSQAYSIDSGVRKAVLCPSDDDYFKINLSAQDNLIIKIKTSSIKTITTALYSSKDINSPLLFANISNAGELNLLSAPESGEYLVKISSSDVVVNYEIEFITNKTTVNCEDDIFEENDSETQAKNIASGNYRNLVMCPLDSDFFALTLNRGDQLELIVSGEGLESVVYMAGSGGTKKIELNSTFNIDITVSGLYYLKLSSKGSTIEPYSFNIRIHSSNFCTDDAFEENDSFSNPAPILINRENRLVLCAGDDDWYLIKTYGNPTKITLKSDSGIRFEIYSENDASEPILYSDEYDSKTHIAEFEGLPNTLLLKIPAETIKKEYTLQVFSETRDCIDDIYEHNNSISDAVILQDGDYKNLKICNGDQDFYAFDLNSGENIDITINFSTNQADIDIILIDPSGREVAYSISTSDTERIDYTATYSGRYWLNVFSWDNASADYSMSIKITDSPSICLDDRFEDNDFIQTARPLDSSEIYGLIVCYQDYDYYSIVLNKGDRLSVGVFYNESKGRLYTALLSRDGNTVFSTGELQSGDIVLELTAPNSDEYILLVRGSKGDVKNEYDILIDIKRDTTCVDDRYEENDSTLYAPSISDRSIDSAILCPRDTDVYKILLNKGDTILVDSSVISSGSYNYSLLLLSPTGGILDSQSKESKDKSVIAEAEESGYHYVTLKNNSNERLQYRLTPIIDGLGGKVGEEIVTLYPFETIDSQNPRLYEIIFSRTPYDSVVEELYISLIVEHKRCSDILITAQYAEAKEGTLWDGFGSTTDNGFDDDREDDADIELYNRVLAPARGWPADKSLLIFIENYGDLRGEIIAIEAKIIWKIK